MLISGLTSGWRTNTAPAPSSPPPQQPQETAPAQQTQPVPAEEQAVAVQPEPTPDVEAGYDPDAMARAAEGSQVAGTEPAPDATPAAAPAARAPRRWARPPLSRMPYRCRQIRGAASG